MQIGTELFAAITDIVGAEPNTPDPVLVLAAFFYALAKDYGLSEHRDLPDIQLDRIELPTAAAAAVDCFMGAGASSIDSDSLRGRLYEACVDLSRDYGARKKLNKNRALTEVEVRMLAQIYWNLEANDARPLLPIPSGQDIPVAAGKVVSADIKVPGKSRDFAKMVWTARVKEGAKGLGSGYSFRSKGARLAVLMAQSIVNAENREISLSAATLRATTDEHGKLIRLIRWPNDAPADAESRVEPSRPQAEDNRSATVAATRTDNGVIPAEEGRAARRPGDRLTGPTSTPFNRQDRSLQASIEQAARQVSMPPDLTVVATRISTLDPAHFLSGASLNGAEVSEYAVSRRVEVDGDEFDVDSIASRLAQESMVGYLISGAGEGKSTYLHALCAALSPRAIVFRWRVSGHLDWAKLQEFRETVESLDSANGVDELPVIVVGEFATKLTREHEDALIDIVQGIPAELAPPRISLVLAGRPAWLNRIRRGVSTGQTMRLVPLSEAEAELLIEKLTDAYTACLEAKGPAWTADRFPNLGRFLSEPSARRLAIFLQGESLVGSLLRAAYGQEFIRRLIAEYTDLEPAEREAYLVVSLATSGSGGISESLLESICSDADIERASGGTPWQRDLDGIHSARHEMIGKLIVEDKDASTDREITHAMARVVDAASFSREARELFLNSVRIFDETRSLIPDQRRRPESRFRAALRSAILEDRDSWERVKRSIGTMAGDYLAFAYALHRLLPARVSGEENTEFLLAQVTDLLERAEAAAPADSPLASQIRYRRVFAERDVRRSRGEDVDDLRDVRALLPMLGENWPDAQFYAQFVSLGLSTLKRRELDDEQEDDIAEAVLQAWQRLRVEGDIAEQVYAYSTFVAREVFSWPLSRRLTLWETAWEFSRALSNPDGSLACLIDDELIKLEKGSAADRIAIRGRRQHVLSESVARGQDNAEVLLRFADVLAADDDAARLRLVRVARPLATSDSAITRSMALHAMAVASRSAEERLEYLRAAMPAYEESMISRDDWLTRGPYWKRGLRELRHIVPYEASVIEPKLARAGRKFGV